MRVMLVSLLLSRICTYLFIVYRCSTQNGMLTKNLISLLVSCKFWRTYTCLLENKFKHGDYYLLHTYNKFKTILRDYIQFRLNGYKLLSTNTTTWRPVTGESQKHRPTALHRAFPEGPSLMLSQGWEIFLLAATHKPTAWKKETENFRYRRDTNVSYFLLETFWFLIACCYRPG